jgi:nucleoside-diphosphate kinase
VLIPCAVGRVPSHRPATGYTPHRINRPQGYQYVTERTLVLVKPDGVQRLLAGRIIARYEERGLKIVGLKLVHVDRELAERHYAAHKGKPFFEGLVSFITSGPLVVLALEGQDAIAHVRAMNGATRPTEAAPGTIRGDFAVEMGQNLVHASDSPESAATELGIWFRPSELLSYERAVDRWVAGPQA